jgi:hypothetical protein
LGLPVNRKKGRKQVRGIRKRRYSRYGMIVQATSHASIKPRARPIQKTLPWDEQKKVALNIPSPSYTVQYSSKPSPANISSRHGAFKLIYLPMSQKF